MNNPLINILIRTSNRPNYFANCMKSIQAQTYTNYRLIVSYDDEKDLKYINYFQNDNFDVVKVNTISIKDIPDTKESGFYKSPYNLYLNTLMNEVKEGWILYLDDDDKFTSKTSLRTIINHIQNEDNLILWRVLVYIPHKVIVPDCANFGNEPRLCNIGGSCVLFHNKYIKEAQWDGYSCGDYRVISNLYKIIPDKIWINEVLIANQTISGFGKRNDL